MFKNKKQQGSQKARNIADVPVGNRRPGRRPQQPPAQYTDGTESRPGNTPQNHAVKNQGQRSAQGSVPGAGLHHPVMNHQAAVPPQKTIPSHGAGSARPSVPPSQQQRGGGGNPLPSFPDVAETGRPQQPQQLQQPARPSISHGHPAANPVPHAPDTQSTVMANQVPTFRPAGKTSHRASRPAPPVSSAGPPSSSIQNPNDRPTPQHAFGRQTTGTPLSASSNGMVGGQRSTHGFAPQGRRPESIQTMPPAGRNTITPPVMGVQPHRVSPDIVQGHDSNDSHTQRITPQHVQPVHPPAAPPRQQVVPQQPNRPTQQQAIPQQPNRPLQQQAIPQQPNRPLQQQAIPQQPNRPMQQQAIPQQPNRPMQQQVIPQQPNRPLQQQAIPQQPNRPLQQQAIPQQPNKPMQQQAIPQQPSKKAALDKKRPHKKKKKRSKLLTAFCITMALLVGVVGGAMIYFGNMYSLMGTDMELQGDEFEGIDGTISFEINSDDLEAAGIGEVSTTSSLRSDPMVQNILLLGSDRRENKSKSDRGWNADTIIILSIDKRHSTLKMTSILRDSYVNIPGHRDDRINAAYALGGATLMMKTIESNFGIKIDRYATVSFSIFSKIVDMIGGIDLEITAGEAREINSRAKEQPKVSAGLVHLNGRQTLEYARIRKIDDDFARTSRQRKVLELIIEKVKGSSLTEIHNLLYEALPLIATNLSQSEVLALVGEVMTILQYPVESTSIPASQTWQDKTIRGMQVLVLDMEANRRTISQFIFESGISKYYGNTHSGYTYGYGYGNGYGYGYYSTRSYEDSAYGNESPQKDDEGGDSLDAATS